MPHLLFLFICLAWGTSFLLMKYAEPVFGPLGVGAWRVVAGAAALWGLWRLQRQTWPVSRRELPALIGLAMVGYALPFALQPYVIREVEAHAAHGSAFMGMMICFVPLFTLLASIPMLKVYPTVRQVVGVVGGLGFLGLLFGAELRQGVPPHLFFLGALTPFCYGIANTYVKRRFHHISPLALTMTALGLSALLLVPLSLGVRPIEPERGLATALPALLVLGVICTGMAGFFMYKLIHGHGPLYAGMVAYVIPCVAVVVGWASGETLAPGQLLAMVGVFAMVALVQVRPAAAPAPQA